MDEIYNSHYCSINDHRRVGPTIGPAPRPVRFSGRSRSNGIFSKENVSNTFSLTTSIASTALSYKLMTTGVTLSSTGVGAWVGIPMTLAGSLGVAGGIVKSTLDSITLTTGQSTETASQALHFTSLGGMTFGVTAAFLDPDNVQQHARFGDSVEDVVTSAGGVWNPASKSEFVFSSYEFLSGAQGSIESGETLINDWSDSTSFGGYDSFLDSGNYSFGSFDNDYFGGSYSDVSDFGWDSGFDSPGFGEFDFDTDFDSGFGSGSGGSDWDFGIDYDFY